MLTLLYGIIAILTISLIITVGFSVYFISKNSQNISVIKDLNLKLQNAEKKLQLLDEENSNLLTKNIKLNSEFTSHQRYMEEKIKYIEQTKEDMTLKFRDISSELLKSQSRQINENQRISLSQMLTPFKEQLQAFQNEISKTNNENTKNKASFDEQFKIMIELNNNLCQDAQNLTDALRGSKKMQGDWGEIELNRILEVSGLRKDIDFYTQENFKNENNQNMRPDVIVRLPNNRSVIVDSKVSMNDYISFVNAENEDDKSLYLQKHIQCIKNHIDELSGKEYQKLLKDESLDYVVIFIPIESAFVSAIQKDPMLYDYAYKKNVALTTPSSLLPILRTVENLWRIENQNKYVQKIAEAGGYLYDKLANFVDDMKKIDKALYMARQNYDTALSKLSTGKGNALSLASRLKEFGAKTNKVIGIDFDDTENELLPINDYSEEKAQ